MHDMLNWERCVTGIFHGEVPPKPTGIEVEPTRESQWRQRADRAARHGGSRPIQPAEFAVIRPLPARLNCWETVVVAIDRTRFVAAIVGLRGTEVGWLGGQQIYPIIAQPPDTCAVSKVALNLPTADFYGIAAAHFLVI